MSDSPQTFDVLVAARRFNVAAVALTSAVADRLEINTSDLNCMNILSLTGPMTAGQLAKAMMLTTASMTGLIDRLESAGYVRRERDQHDRRRVLVSATPHAYTTIAPIFATMIQEWTAILAQYTEAELGVLVDFFARSQPVIERNIRAIIAPEAT